MAYSNFPNETYSEVSRTQYNRLYLTTFLMVLKGFDRPDNDELEPFILNFDPAPTVLKAFSAVTFPIFAPALDADFNFSRKTTILLGKIICKPHVSFLEIFQIYVPTRPAVFALFQ